MDLINKQVMHHTFGTGRIVSVEDGRIVIRFAEGDEQRKFCYPSSFEQYLEMCDKEAQEFVSNDLQKLFDKIESERIERAQRLVDEEKLREEEKKAAKKTKAKATAKKTAEKKAATKKAAKKVLMEEAAEEEPIE